MAEERKTTNLFLGLISLLLGIVVSLGTYLVANVGGDVKALGDAVGQLGRVAAVNSSRYEDIRQALSAVDKRLERLESKLDSKQDK